MNILIKFKNSVIESLRDNWKLIIVLYILFIVCFIASWILSADKVQAIGSGVSISNYTPSQNFSGPVDLFVQNEFGGIVVYFASIFFAFPAVLALAYNALNLGVLGQLFSVVVPNGGIKYIIYLIPHGIFEITATVLQSAAGILLFLFIFRFIKAMITSETHGFSDSFEKTKKALIQSIILMIFSTILLIIAAPIEAYVSVPLSEFISGFLT